MEFNLREVELILDAVTGLPPTQYRLACDTNDRQQHWHDCKRGFSHLHQALQNYFSGQEFSLHEIPEDLRDPFALWTHWWIDLYSALHTGWSYLRVVATKDNLPLPETPGMMLAELLNDVSDEIFLEAFPEIVTGNAFCAFSPRTEYSRYKGNSKIQLLLSEQPLTKSEQKRVAKHRRAVKGRDPWKKFSARLVFCTATLSKVAQTDRNVKRKLKAFQLVDQEFKAFLLASLHPSKKVRGFAWNKGRQQHSAPGGVYR